MNRHLFERVLEGVQKRDDYFTTKTDAVGRQGIAGIVKVVAALKKLAYGVSSDMLDDSLEMSATAISESMKRFCDAVIEVIRIINSFSKRISSSLCSCLYLYRNSETST